MTDTNELIKKWILFPDPLVSRSIGITSTKSAFTAAGAEIQEAQVEPPTADQLIEIKNQFIQSTDDLLSGFEESMNLSKSNYLLINAINIIIVFFGIVLLSFSIYYSWVSQKFELFSAITAGLGVTDFMALFLVNPQTKIRKNLADLVQMRMIYNAWINESYSAYLSLAINGYGADNILKYQNSLNTFTTNAVNLIENNIGNDTKSSNAQSAVPPNN